jgi:hypothetical protein
MLFFDLADFLFRKPGTGRWLKTFLRFATAGIGSTRTLVFTKPGLYIIRRRLKAPRKLLAEFILGLF